MSPAVQERVKAHNAAVRAARELTGHAGAPQPRVEEVDLEEY
jgi:hypothetical protein